jgi:hypothetical protein
MSSNKKGLSVLPATPTTFVLLIVSAILIAAVVGLVISSFFGSSNQTPITAGLAPTATLVDDAPTIPPPTGPIPPKAPTFDINQLYTLPTRALAPGETPPITDPRNPKVTYVAPTIAPLIILTPSTEWTTYRDPNLGFSFQYPSNWHIDAPAGLTPSEVAAKGTYIIIENYVVNGLTKGGVPEDALKIDIAITPEFAQYGNLDIWYSDFLKNSQDPDHPIPASQLPSVKHLVINNVPAIRWTGPLEGTHAALGKGKWLYVITAYPTNSRYLSTFDQIISTIQIP